jgi:hypothetical protein
MEGRMTNPFIIILSLALWEIIKYCSRNLRGMAVDAYHVRFSRYEAYSELKEFKQAPRADRYGSWERKLQLIMDNRARRHKEWEEEAKTYSPEKQAAVDNPQRYFVGGF